MSEPSAATVRHISRDHIHFAPGPSHSVTIFQLKGRGAEAIISARDGSESSLLKIEAPAPGRKIVISRNEDGSFDILYKDAEPDHA